MALRLFQNGLRLEEERRTCSFLRRSREGETHIRLAGLKILERLPGTEAGVELLRTGLHSGAEFRIDLLLAEAFRIALQKEGYYHIGWSEEVVECFHILLPAVRSSGSLEEGLHIHLHSHCHIGNPQLLRNLDFRLHSHRRPGRREEECLGTIKHLRVIKPL